MPGGGRGHVAGYLFHQGRIGSRREHAAHEAVRLGGEIRAHAADERCDLLLGIHVCHVVQGVDADQTAHPAGQEARRFHDHRPRHGMSHQHCSLELELVDHRRHVPGVGGHRPVLPFQAGLAVAPEVDRHDGVCLREFIDLGAPVAAVATPAVNEDQGRIAVSVHVESDLYAVS